MGWLRDTWHEYLGYMAVGVGAIPAGVIYAIFSLHGYQNSWWVLIPILTFGMICGVLLKRWVGKKLQ
jgi:hypothetical protein